MSKADRRTFELRLETHLARVAVEEVGGAAHAADAALFTVEGALLLTLVVEELAYA